MRTLLQLLQYDDSARPIDVGTSINVRQTASAGRAVFASRHLKANEIILDSAGPCSWTFLDEYRKELCSWCFYYDGRVLNEHKLKSQGKVLRSFCSGACLSKFTQDVLDIGLEAIEIVEALIREISHHDAKALPGAARQKDFEWLWHQARATADLIKNLRFELATKQTKSRKALNKAVKSINTLELQDDADIIRLIADTVLMRHLKPDQFEQLLKLAPSMSPYNTDRNGLATLQSHIRIYLQLVVRLPLELVDCCTPETVLAVVTRDSGNSFGIWSSDGHGHTEEETERTYLLGYGIWSNASMFNHSCSPTVQKSRVDRNWVFRTLQDVEEGGELSISYLGGTEKTLDVYQRREKLKSGWNFECHCARCIAEASILSCN